MECFEAYGSVKRLAMLSPGLKVLAPVLPSASPSTMPVMFVALFDRAGQITDSDYSISVLAGAFIAIGIHRALRSP